MKSKELFQIPGRKYNVEPEKSSFRLKRS